MPNHIQELAGKAMATVKSAKGTIEGLSGIFKTLMEEHGKVSALLTRVKLSTDADVRRELWPTIREELLSHEKGEVAVLYPVYKQHPETSAIEHEHNVDASSLQKLIETLHVMDVEDEAWGPTFARLVAMVEEHVAREEDSYFPTAHGVFGAEAKRLDREYQQVKEAALRALR
jgi:hemerythrin superfamily protein